ncbi:NUP85-like protein [Mya arenaria]|uniref:Nuclear pore complex protein Nup85 n=1 Tax=Mya arenaria TaxID=6604 RepID=A0ABY7DFJ7_MYAAR|nr:NUP85-like protein [Mya arenaria]
MKIFNMTELIWSLCEILWIDLAPGQLDKVRILLSHNAAARTDAFLSMDEVLRKMPIFNILCGEESVFAHIKDLCETWYHMLVSKMLYQRPTVKSVDLHYYAQASMDEFRGDGRMSEMDSILLSTLEFDVHQVIKDCRFGHNLREYLLLDYATSLMSHCSLWQVGVDYLDQCHDTGRHYLEQFIDNMPIETERKAHKLLNICEKRNMPEQIKSICKVMGMRCLKNQRLGAALSWFLRSKDVAFATLIAEKFLSEYNEHGEFSNLDLLDNLGSSMLISHRLTFLAKYREYHRLYEERELYAAGSLLLSLLTSRLAPRE